MKEEGKGGNSHIDNLFIGISNVPNESVPEFALI